MQRPTACLAFLLKIKGRNVSSFIIIILEPHLSNILIKLFSFRPEAVAECVVDLIKDESGMGQVVKVTYEEGVEYLNYNDVSNDTRSKVTSFPVHASVQCETI